MEYKVTQKIAETPEEKPSFIIEYDKRVISCPKCKLGIPLDIIEGKEIFSMKCSNCGYEKP